VEVSVVKEGKSGVLLGVGAEEAVVRVTPLTSEKGAEVDISGKVQSVIEELLDRLDVTASVVSYVPPFAEGTDDTSAPIGFHIKGDDLGILIGWRGQTLSTLQYIVRLIVAQQTKIWQPITIDIEGYKQRRYETLKSLALRIAERVGYGGQPFTLEPMPAYERRIIHLTLADHPGVTTQSIGWGESRKVVIQPDAPAAD